MRRSRDPLALLAVEPPEPRLFLKKAVQFDKTGCAPRQDTL